MPSLLQIDTSTLELEMYKTRTYNFNFLCNVTLFAGASVLKDEKYSVNTNSKFKFDRTHLTKHW